MQLRDYQLDAVERMHNGCILCGGVGSGKSLTALAYYFTEECGGYLDGTKQGYDTDYIPMSDPEDLYIITTARKRDTKEWEAELAKFLISPNPKASLYSETKVVIDSWNNIGKHVDASGAFFIFDEQRLVGYGPWVKAFFKIVKNNNWILLSATPGDKWLDYMPVFIANGYFRNKTEFLDKHAIMGYSHNHWEIREYRNEGKLLRYKNDILVNMKYQHEVHAHHETVDVPYDKDIYRSIMRDRWNIYEDRPIQNVSELCYVARRSVNSDPSRVLVIKRVLKDHPKVIIFYNYDYELEILKNADWGKDIQLAEWNGHRHQPIPIGDSWIYLVQYTAGAEGWNCIETDTVIFYSLNYSYKIMVQSAGRIDRMNTPFTDLYYYRLKSSCPLDIAISRALKQKKKFNENKFVLG